MPVPCSPLNLASTASTPVLTSFFRRLLAREVASTSRKGLVRRCKLALLVLFAAICLSAAAHATTWTVTDASDNPTDTGSLRYAMTHAVAGDTIAFSTFFNNPQTITLSSPLPTINITASGTLSIVGPGTVTLTIDGNGYTAFTIASGAIDISGLTIKNAAPAIVDNYELRVSNCTFINNSSSTTGGAIFANAPAGYLIVYNSTFISNTAVNSGGAIEIAGGMSSTIGDNTFYKNQTTAPLGVAGAIHVQSGAYAGIENNTFVANSTQFASSAMQILTASSFTPSSVSNNIFYDNSAPLYTFSGSANTSADHNLYYGNSGVTPNACVGCTPGETNAITGKDPMLMPFGNYGGYIQTFALLPGSGAICAGLASDTGDLGSDQRGYAMDPNCSSASMVDVGSVQTNQFMVNVTTDDPTTATKNNCVPSSSGKSCSFRDAMLALDANIYGDLTFAPSVTGTITLTTAPLQKLDNGPNQLNIIGPGPQNLTISGNYDTNVGSIIYVDYEATTFIYGITLAKGAGVVLGGATYGGALFVNGPTTVSNSAIVNNIVNTQSSQLGGGIYVNNGPFTLIDSTVSGNTVGVSPTLTGTGGGIATSGSGVFTIINSTISGNTATWRAGGIFDGGNVFNMYSTTVSNNQTSDDSGGIYVGGKTLTLNNSIVSGNSSLSTNNDLNNAFGTVVNNNSLVGDSNINLATLSSYGGTTQTMVPLPGSSAICEGLAANIYPGTTTDQRGYPNENSTYTGYTVSSPCVDAGAVQTNYALHFIQQPTDTSVGSVISPAPTVSVVDNASNPVNGVQVPIELAVGSGTLGGTLTRTTTAGVATFNDLTVSQSGSGDELGATLTVSPVGASDVVTISVDSAPFDVAGAFSKFAVQANSPQQAGVPFSFTVTAEDSGSNTINGYSGTVHFTSTDGSSTLPANYTFVAGDHGTHTFTNGATLKTLGAQTITATDTGDSNTGTSNSITVNAGPASYLTVTGYPSPVNQYTSNTGTVTAYDQFNNVATSFTGPATISSSTDVTATITQPSSWSNGAATFSLAFDHSGSQIITASATGLSSGSEIGIVVNAPPSYVVTTTSDDNPGIPANCPVGNSPPSSDCTLRDALAAAAASGSGNITFSPTVFNSSKTINIGFGGPLFIRKFTNITGTTSGSGATLKNLVTVDGSAGFIGVFTITGPVTSISNLNNLNIVGGSDSFGGCINNDVTLTINMSTVSGCNSELGGGILNTGIMTLNNSTVNGNSATNSGGGVYNDTSSTLTVNNSTISGNTSLDGGGIYNLGTLIVNDTTVSGNSATTGNGGGIYTDGTLTIGNSIVSGNSAPSHPSFADLYNSATQINLDGNQLGTSSINLAPLGNYGGPTQTMVALPGSPAICTGLTANIPAGITTDQRGNPRASTDCTSGNIDSGATQSIYTLAFTTEPGSQQQGGVAFTPSPQVQLLDNGLGINLSGVSIAMQADLGTLSGTTPQTTDSSGFATFGDLSIAQTETNDYLIAKTTLYGIHFIDVASNTFNVVNLTLTPGSLPNAGVGLVYSQTFTGHNGTAPYSYSKTAGAFPAGLTLNASTGVFSGTPTAGGTFNFTITVTDSNNATASQAYTLTVAPPTITLAPINLPNGTYGTAYSQMVSASGGTAPYTYQVFSGSLPSGLTLNPNSGVISGTPTAPNVYNFTIMATDSSTGTGPYTSSRVYTVTIGKATATIHVTPYSVSYDGSPHTATATATGYQGVNLISEMNLSGTTHTQPGTYTNDTWTFTDTTGKYLNASGTVTDVINKLSQTITFTPPFPTTGFTNDATFKLLATSTSGLTVSFTSTTPSVCAVTTFGTPAVPGAKVLSAGNCIIQATQAGNSTYSAATPVLHTFTIVPAPTNTTLSASSTSVKSGASVTFTASVSSFVSASLTGTVSFYNGATLLGTSTVTNGKAVYSTSALSVGTHNISAVYSGATDFQSSTSATVMVTVTQ